MYSTSKRVRLTRGICKICHIRHTLGTGGTCWKCTAREARQKLPAIHTFQIGAPGPGISGSLEAWGIKR